MRRVPGRPAALERQLGSRVSAPSLSTHSAPAPTPPLHADHGWRFDKEGTCTTIPQASSDEAEAAAAANKRACAISYPVTEAQGMLFVYGEGGAAAMEESSQVDPQTCKLTERTEAAGACMSCCACAHAWLPARASPLPADASRRC